MTEITGREIRYGRTLTEDEAARLQAHGWEVADDRTTAINDAPREEDYSRAFAESVTLAEVGRGRSLGPDEMERSRVSFDESWAVLHPDMATWSPEFEDIEASYEANEAEIQAYEAAL